MRKDVAKLMPVPERVMNDKVRSFQLDPAERNFIVPSGYEPNVYVGIELLEREERSFREFGEWTVAQGKAMPPGFLDENREVLRILSCSDHDF